MYGIIGLLLTIIAISNADIPVNPLYPPQQVYCGETPGEIFSCVPVPSLIPPGAPKKCEGSYTNQCERMTCVVREAGWLNGTSLNYVKLNEHLDQFAKDHPDWRAAIQETNTKCLAPNLPAQGYFLNCPAYDVTHCMLVTLVKNIPPSLWPSTQKCAYPRQYAESCPFCPSECFTGSIPIGSCNACLLLPRSP